VEEVKWGDVSYHVPRNVFCTELKRMIQLGSAPTPHIHKCTYRRRRLNAETNTQRPPARPGFAPCFTCRPPRGRSGGAPKSGWGKEGALEHRTERSRKGVERHRRYTLEKCFRHILIHRPLSSPFHIYVNCNCNINATQR